jgi:hypothetical protein
VSRRVPLSGSRVPRVPRPVRKFQQQKTEQLQRRGDTTDEKSIAGPIISRHHLQRIYASKILCAHASAALRLSAIYPS